VIIVGPELVKANAAWLPIQAPPGDVRYIPESAVAKSGANSGVQPVSATTTGYTVPPGYLSPLAQADAKRLEAMQLYQVAAQSSDPTQRFQAQSWLQVLQRAPNTQGPVGQPGYPSNTGTAVLGAGPKVALGGTTAPSQLTGGNTTLYPTPNQAGPAQWSQWGTLRKTAFQKNGQPMYRLEDQRGAPLGYGMAAPGLSLEMYVGRTVCLYGTTAYGNDNAMRGTYTIASQVALPNQ